MKTITENKTRAAESGNVLFLILIAVALFAALSYAVTQSTRTGGGSGDNETSLISSAQLTQYPAGLRTAVVRMIIGGTDVQNIEFNVPSDFNNCTGAPTSYNNCVFHPSGGGATYSLAPREMMASGSPGTWVFNTENQINLLGTTNAGGPQVDTADMIAFLPNITQTLCTRINAELGLPSTPPTESLIDLSTQMTNGVDICNGACNGDTIGLDVTELDGQPFGCFQQPAGTYHYFHVLVER
ncbi:MAG: hypothetical protein H6868_04160 [Rhodospirillales bacterium]|nr:hypothetical protein [Rhodospirillales bacterium]